MAEHVRLSSQEAKDKVASLRQVVMDTYEKTIKNQPFFVELRDGTLPRTKLRGWVTNWYTFAVEVNTGMATAYHQFVGFFKRHPECEDLVAQKIGEEFTTPGIGGHARMLPALGRALGVEPQQMIEAELIPEARGLVDFFVRSWIDVPLAECYAVHLEEEVFGFISQDFRAALPKYGVSAEEMKYFRIHEEADLGEHSNTNQIILQKALEDGYGNERAGWPLEYCARVAVEMVALFFEGVYRRY
jgi:pyrroloquinoline quinone (PQQ) biosynthesis protein C